MEEPCLPPVAEPKHYPDYPDARPLHEALLAANPARLYGFQNNGKALTAEDAEYPLTR